MEKEHLLTTKELALFLNCSVSLINKLKREGKIPEGEFKLAAGGAPCGVFRDSSGAGSGDGRGQRRGTVVTMSGGRAWKRARRGKGKTWKH